jgi:hypothetical protein
VTSADITLRSAPCESPWVSWRETDFGAAQLSPASPPLASAASFASPSFFASAAASRRASARATSAFTSS